MLVAVVAVSLVGGLALALSPLTAASSPRSFTVEAGWGGGKIASELERAGLIRSTFAFILITNWTRTGDRLKAGTYLLSSDMSARQIAERIAAGDAVSDDISVTVPEGMNVWEIDKLLASKSLIESGSFARIYHSQEGTLWPDTYRFDVSLASRSHQFGDARAIGSVMVDEFKNRAIGAPPDELIIASMLEKEAKQKEDMQLVAGIIARRRQLGMPLQIDATVAYGWCLARWLPMNSLALCDVTQAPLATQVKVDGPYNTYTRKGLPVGPISNPGETALWAAAHPTASEYLYYLSTRDGSKLIFAKTAAEHLANRAKYLGL